MDLLTLGLIFLGVKASQASNTADKLEYYPKSVIWSKTRKQFVFYMEILNPTKHDLKVDSFFGGLFIGETKVASIERGNAFTIKANDRTKVSFPVKVIGLGLGKAVAAIIKDPTKPITLQVLGTARALGIDNAVNEQIPLSLE